MNLFSQFISEFQGVVNVLFHLNYIKVLKHL